MKFQFNPDTHPWLHRIACLYTPYAIAACHSVFSCPLPYHKCQRCVDETRIYYFPTGDLAAETPEEKNAEQVRWLLHLAGHKFGSPENLAELDAAAKEAKRKVWRTVFDV